MRRSLVVSLALLAIVRSPAVAQTCQGLASFSSGQMQVAANGQFSSNTNAWGAAVSYGVPSGIFGGASLATRSFDGIDPNSTEIGANAGYQMKLGRTGKMHLCPVANLTLGMGPDASPINNSSTDVAFGLAVGTSMGTNPRMEILPSAGLGLQYRKLKTENTTTSAVQDTSATYGVAHLGLGFVFNQQIAVRPSIEIPLSGGDLNETAFGVTVAYSFGSKGISKGRRR